MVMDVLQGIFILIQANKYENTQAIMEESTGFVTPRMKT
jgi:hypothetical protein